MYNYKLWAEIKDVSWPLVLNQNITLGSMYKVVPTEGYLAWEYNPLRNYRLNENMYEKDGKYYTIKEVENDLINEYKNNPINKDINFTFTAPNTGAQIRTFNKIITNYNIKHADGNPNFVLVPQLATTDKGKPLTEEQCSALFGETVINKFKLYTLREAGELVDFITNELSFDIQHPVDILPLYSYDGSVNLILNDGLNIPRLINSRFTVTGRNTYKIVDRKGDNDTNIYDQGNQFDVDTSLFKNVNKIPKLEYLGTATGNMKIGNYHFYFKYSDADGNESDWVSESGLVSVFIGSSPYSTNTGIKDENSTKSVRFNLSNIDIGYSFVKVYYTRYSADIDSNLVVQAKRIDKNFLISNSGICLINITGDENETDITLEEINSHFDVILNSQTLCSAANRLFMANIHKTRIEYDLLSKLSLCFCPHQASEPYPLIDNIDENYNILSLSDGYYDTKYIYDKTGYWPGELYRIGIVYILKDGSLSPVFNIRGATEIVSDASFLYKIELDILKMDADTSFSDILKKILYSEEDYRIIGGKVPNENAKGVIQLQSENSDNKFPVLGINIKANKLVIQELKSHVKGFFFVRQKRIPLTLCLGIVIGLDKESRTPTLPTLAGVVSNINVHNSFIETSDLNDINYVSEGFLSRYTFSLKAKKLNTGKNILKALGVVSVLAAAAIATVFTCGVAGVALGTGLAATAVTGGSVVAGTIGVIGSVSGITFGLAAGSFGIAHGILKGRQNRNRGLAQAIKGRNEAIPSGYERKEQEDSRKLILDINDRYIIKDFTKNVPDAIIVPDYQVNLPYYNQFLTGETFTVKLNNELPITNYLSDGYFDSSNRHFYVSSYQRQPDTTNYSVKLVGVPDGCPIKMIGDQKYCARAGYPEEAYQYEFQGVAYDDSVNKKDNSDIVRGNYGSFVGMLGYRGHAGDLLNIMIPGYSDNKIFDYVQLRAQDTSAFYAISDRIDIHNLNSSNGLLQGQDITEQDFDEIYYRGDCYICLYTHRIIRNFNDPSAPYNDKIVDENSWKNNYNPDKPEKYSEINLGDVNAVQLGLWLTFLLRSSYNLNIRTIDKSHVDETLMCGNARSFYPHYGQLASGNQKIPDSDLYNKGFSKSVSEKYYFEVPDVPYIKQEFLNRIVFSDIHVNDAYKNGFRVLRTMNHKDYPMTYGSITKLIELKNALLIVFEHGIGMVSIDNSAEHSSLILSDLNIISDTYGSQWRDSVIKTPSGIYGVDTVAKKIWRVKEGQIELISDMRVQEFLNLHISLTERELTPIIGVRNVKTFYNAFKHDVMFTFYDNLLGIHEKSWNLCWNEILGIFTTFYSWIPSEMQNIDNIPFSFNRDTVKAISKLGVSDHGNDFSDGVTLTNNVLKITTNDEFTVDNKTLQLYYLNEQGIKSEYEFDPTELNKIIKNNKFIGFLHLNNRVLLDDKVEYVIEYELLRDCQRNDKLFDIVNTEISITPTKTLFSKEVNIDKVKVSYLKLKNTTNLKDLLSELYWRNNAWHSYADIDANKIGTNITYDVNGNITSYDIHINKPIFKNKQGKRLMLDKKDQINPDKIVRYLNIKANLSLKTEPSNEREAYYNLFIEDNPCMIYAGYFESQVAITTDHNLALLSTDFWKHGQAGIIDITDKIYPTYWYGQQHPFEFECVVVDDPSVHKVFTNLELVANKVKPESFHYEVVGDVYDFAEDKPTMYFRLEALKALYQYNSYDIEYNSNFLEIEPKQHNRSADFPKYYSRWDTINDIYDSYKRFSAPLGFNYDHLAGAEIVYYPTRNEFRVWNHVKAIDVDSLSQDIATSVIKANCRYLEDKWLISINPIIVTYKNEIDKSLIESGQSMFSKDAFGVYKYSSWADNANKTAKLPPINIQGTKLEETLNTNIRFPGDDETRPEDGKDNALYGLYDLTSWKQGLWRPIDPTKNKDRRETDVRGKFMKVRIRYSGEELAIIDFLNTIYQISFA